MLQQALVGGLYLQTLALRFDERDVVVQTLLMLSAT
jgi:hypothetical protein